MKKFFNIVFRVFLILLAMLCLIAVIIFFTFPLPGQIPIMMYHFIGSRDVAESNQNVVTEKTFKKQMTFLKRFGYRVISLEELNETLNGIRKPKGREIVLTFDDGAMSVATKAAPITNSFHFPITLFLINQHLKTGGSGSLRTKDVLEMAKNPLIHFGAHSRTHPFLSQIPDVEVADEIAECKRELESMLGIPINYFAYPYGDFDQRSIDMVQKAGYHLAFTTSPKKLQGLSSDIYSIPRVKISETASNPLVFWVKVSGIYGSFKMWRHTLWQKKIKLTLSKVNNPSA